MSSGNSDKKMNLWQLGVSVLGIGIWVEVLGASWELKPWVSIKQRPKT